MHKIYAYDIIATQYFNLITEVAMKHFIFDFNGVLIDDEKVHLQAFQDSLAEIYNISLSYEDYIEYFAGKTDEHGFKTFMSSFEIELDLERLIKTKNIKYFETLEKTGIPVVTPILDFIHEIKNHSTLSLVTGSNRNEVEFILRKLQLMDVFECKIYAEDVENSKPNPEGYLKVLQQSKYKKKTLL